MLIRAVEKVWRVFAIRFCSGGGSKKEIAVGEEPLVQTDDPNQQSDARLGSPTSRNCGTSAAETTGKFWRIIGNN